MISYSAGGRRKTKKNKNKIKHRHKRTKRHIHKKRGKRTRTKRQQHKIVGGGKFVSLQCNPTSKLTMNGPNESCYSTDQIQELKRIWNSKNPHDKIDKVTDDDIWNELRTKNKARCDKESCWVKEMVKSLNLKKEMLNSFAPEAPSEWDKKPNTWLTNVDIAKVMKQYTDAYYCFTFLGPSAIDYDTIIDGTCVCKDLCNFNLDSHIQNKKTKIGITFNTDTHEGGGEHWISLFIHIPKKTIFFFDSVGALPPKSVKRFADKVIQQGKELTQPIDFIFDHNHPVEHQYKNTECGVYSLFFIIYMLEDKINGEYLKTHIISDSAIEKYRKIFFNDKL